MQHHTTNLPQLNITSSRLLYITIKTCEKQFSLLLSSYCGDIRKKYIYLQWSLKCPPSHLKVPLSASCQSATLSNPRSEVTWEGFCSPDARELRHNSSLCAWVHVWAGEEGGGLSAPFKRSIFSMCERSLWEDVFSVDASKSCKHPALTFCVQIDFHLKINPCTPRVSANRSCSLTGNAINKAVCAQGCPFWQKPESTASNYGPRLPNH